MSKLIGVEQLITVSGDGVKIVYKGNRYTKVEEEPNYGDIVRSRGDMDAERGSYYEVEGLRYPKIIDDIGDSRSNFGAFDVFRKDEEVEEPASGGIIKMTLSDGSIIEGRAKDIIEMHELMVETDNPKEDEVQKPRQVEYELELELEPQRAEKGDIIRITKQDGFTMCDMTEGKVYEVVSAMGGWSVLIVDDVGDIASAMDGSYEIVEQKEVKEGDHVIALRDSQFKDIRKGMRGVVTEIGNYEDGYNVEVRSEIAGSYCFFRPKDVKAVGESSNTGKIEPGAKVRIIVPEQDKPKFGWGLVSSGDVGEVISEENDGEFIIKFQSQEQFHAIAKELELVIDDNEEGSSHLEDGDIVEVVEGSFKIKKGDIGVVVSADGTDMPFVQVGRYPYYLKSKLVAKGDKQGSRERKFVVGDVVCIENDSDEDIVGKYAVVRQEPYGPEGGGNVHLSICRGGESAIVLGDNLTLVNEVGSLYGL